MAAIDLVFGELLARYQREQDEGAEFRKIYDKWRNTPKPAPTEIFTNAMQAKAEINKIRLRVHAADITSWAALTSLTEANLMNALAEKIAGAFISGAYDFEFCDGLIIELGKSEFQIDECAFFWDVWHAFDAGEVWVGEENPVEKYTKPMLTDLLGKLNEQRVERT